MAKLAKLIEQILLGRSDANIGFDELCHVLIGLGFSQRTRGSHHIFSHPDVLELINLQRDGGKAKPYQVRQVRAIILQYKLGAEE
ncbi:type II toxin-antitoxin system HicA family toxin [Thiobacillus sp. 65-1402]|jgi:predicted RNA binding protein YcfA (HicA-like mRNA interferase family)|uniref:type II toxin-antitoxin system HicA family toxin n=1 Tax=Thiobacillus sp. 65-1402 TaxID=1895861 RepID=UPI0009623C6C|nr:type II toxin-antitoxin system HicA family toxin [Thiobacillus sp. 65-1402]OJW97911.1 MAG: toxin HicA [Thiobacillus sp. 65-1402]OZA21956.1 MAG: toxin HicA [Hydrogenophilales bacterium 17-64-11]